MKIFNTTFFDNILDFIEKWYYIFLLAILSMALFNLFYNLGQIPIDSWDEARHGVNAYEMIKRNNYIVSTYSYKVDYWNLKPPVSYWAIIFGYKLAGFNPLGLRLFSALAAFCTITTITFFTLYKHGKLASLISAAVITTTIPFIVEHCSRTGDSDSLFVLFFTLSILSILLIDKSIKWLYVAGFSFSMAFLTKSWHAGNIVIIGAIILILNRKIFKFKRKQIVLFILSGAIPILVWMILRYSQDGITFFSTMIGFDLIARTSRTLEGHIGTVYFYLEALQGSYFYWLLPLVSTVLAGTLLLGTDSMKETKNNYIIAIALWILVPLLLYTKAKTKISWYILPVFPPMAICLGTLTSLLLKYKNRNLLLQFILSIMILFSIYKNEASIIERISKPKVDAAQMLIKSLGQQQQLKGKNIYIHHFEQSYLLSAELYADLTPIEGGMEGFIKDNSDKTLLFITKDRKELEEIKRYNFKIIAENEAAYIFTK